MSTKKRLGIGLVVAAGMMAFTAQGRGEQIMMCGVGLGWGIDPAFQPIDTTRAEGFAVGALATDLEDTPAPALFTAMESGEWLAAIRLLETLAETDNDTLVRDNAGMLRPLSSLRAQVLSQLPAEGRRTFRAMYDPLADKLLHDAEQTSDAAQQQALLSQVVEDYALCKAAAAGADRLGDLHFEHGRFTEAARLYDFASNHPESEPDDARLMAKRLHAIARAGDWAGFDTLAEYARFRRGNASVHIAGEDRPLSELIDLLAQQRDATQVGPLAGNGPAMRVPNTTYPAIDLELVDKQTALSLQQAMANQGLLALAGEVARPALVAANGRAYILCLGQLSALNPDTGETIWAHGNAQELAGQITGQGHLMRQGYHQSLQQSGDRLVVTAHDARYVAHVRLRVHDTATGELQWSSANLGEQGQHSYIGLPTVAGNTLYAVCKDPSSNRLQLVAMNLDNGAAQWAVDLGQPAIDSNWGEPQGVDPRIAVGERYVTVLTNNGALIAIDTVRREIAWASTTGLLPGPMRNSPYAQAIQPGGVAIHNGLVLSKDSRDDQLVAIRESDAVRVWSVEVDARATLVHTDSRHAYLLGEELVAYDLNTGERVWWTAHHGDTGQQPAFTDTHALIAGPRRMCRIDLSTGKVDGYREDIPAGPAGSPVVQLNDGVAVVTPTGVRIYETDE